MVRLCPECQAECLPGASRCSFCGAVLKPAPVVRQRSDIGFLLLGFALAFGVSILLPTFYIGAIVAAAAGYLLRRRWAAFGNGLLIGAGIGVLGATVRCLALINRSIGAGVRPAQWTW